MLLDWILILGGLLLLVGGGEALVRGASGLAIIARITPAVVSLTVVAAGTSMPEMVVSAQSALAGSPGLAVGNIVGSNLFNIGAILGLTAVIVPLAIQGNTVRMEWPVMMLAAFQFHLLSRDGVIDRLEGGFFLVAMVVFVAYAVYLGRKVTGSGVQEVLGDVTTASFGRTGKAALALNVGALAAGVAMLAAGSTLLVRGASDIAAGFGVSEAVIGLTIVSAGTSSPELMTSIVAAWRGRADMAVGNIVGSNIFNVLAIGGVTATILPLPVPPEIVQSDNWWMLGASLLLLPLMKSGMRINRFEGGVLLGGFILYIALLIFSV